MLLIFRRWFNNQFYQLMLDSSITWTPMYVRGQKSIFFLLHSKLFLQNAGNRRSPKYQFRATNSNGADVSNMLNTDFELLYHLDLDPTTFEAGCEVNVVSPLKAEYSQSKVHFVYCFFAGHC